MQISGKFRILVKFRRGVVRKPKRRKEGQKTAVYQLTAVFLLPVIRCTSDCVSFFSACRRVKHGVFYKAVTIIAI